MSKATPAAPAAAQGPHDPIEIRLLGEFIVTVDGRHVPAEGWPTLRSAQLVQLLSLADGHRLLRDQAIDALWPRLDPEAGAANLRKAAYHARQVLGSRDAVVLQAGQVMLWPGRDLAVDALRFVREADAALAHRDARACADVASRYPGPLLPGTPYEDWTESHRERLHGRYLELLRAGACWEQLAEADPADEPAHRALIERELAAGNRAAAIRWYARLRSTLQRELGVAPEARTEALYSRCLDGLTSPHRAFFGRELELAQVAGWLRAAPAERQGGLIVTGSGGIGKTAFCDETRAMAEAEGWMVVRIDAIQALEPYGIVAQTIEQLVLADRGLLDRIPAAARPVLAMLSMIAGPAPPLPRAGPPGRHQVIGALRRLLLAASDGHRVMLQVDDAERLDEADLDVLLHLAASGRPVSVMLAARPPAPESSLARGIGRLLRGGQVHMLELAPLADDELERLIAQAAPRPLSESELSRIAELSEGNPFAAIELAGCATSGASPGAGALPASVREAIAARLCDVDESVLALLQRLALAGDRFDTALAEAMAPGSEHAVFELLDKALAAGVLAVSDAQYRFRHELVRQALIERIPPHQRLRVHREAAQRLARLDAPAAVVARHWLAGGSLDEASPWLLTAARQAHGLGAFADVLRYLEPLLEHRPADSEALRLRAESLDALGEPAALQAYREAAAAAGEPESHELLAMGALAQIKQGDPRGALAAIEGVHPRTVEGRLCEALTYSGAAALGVADPAMGTVKAAEARRLALQTGDTGSIVVASWAQAAAAHARGELHSSVWADLQETQHVPHLAVRVFDGHLCITQRFLYGARPYAQVLAFADAMANEARRLGAARGHAFGVILRGEAELLSGDLDAAQEHLALGGRLHRAIGGATGEALSLQRRAELALHRGDRVQARELLDEALDLARQTDIGFHLLDRIYGTRIGLATDPDAALAAVEDAEQAVRGPFETCPGCRITFAVPAAITAARAGRLDLVEQYEPAVDFLADVVMRLPAWYAARDEVRAHNARARGEDPARVADLFREAARGFTHAGHPLDAARCKREVVGRM